MIFSDRVLKYVDGMNMITITRGEDKGTHMVVNVLVYLR